LSKPNGEEFALAQPPERSAIWQGADIGGLRQDIARQQGGGHAFGFMDGVLADLVALADVKISSSAHGAIFEAQREAENLEHRAQLVNVLRHALRVESPAAAALVGIEIGQRHHAQHFAGVDIHHHAAGGLARKGLARRSTSCARMYCTRMSMEVATLPPAAARISSCKPSSKPRTPLLSGSVTPTPGRHCGRRDSSACRRSRTPARQAQMHHLGLGIGRDLAGDQHIGMLGIVEAVEQRRLVGAGGRASRAPLPPCPRTLAGGHKDP
jgi:hypothetical protein